MKDDFYQENVSDMSKEYCIYSNNIFTCVAAADWTILQL